MIHGSRIGDSLHEGVREDPLHVILLGKRHLWHDGWLQKAHTMLTKTQIYATFSNGTCQFFQDAFSVRVSRRIPKGPGPGRARPGPGPGPGLGWARPGPGPGPGPGLGLGRARAHKQRRLGTALGNTYETNRGGSVPPHKIPANCMKTNQNAYKTYQNAYKTHLMRPCNPFIGSPGPV